MKATIILVATALSAGLPAIAQDASQGAAPALSTIIAGLEAQDYRVTGVDVDRDAIEVDAVTLDNRSVELRLDPTTGEVLSETTDD